MVVFQKNGNTKRDSALYSELFLFSAFFFKKTKSVHPYLAKLSNQVFLAQNKYYHLKLLAENGEFNEMMGIIIKGVPYKWPNVQKSK